MTDAVPHRIFHIATAADWREAIDAGTYTTSTRGHTLAEEGFIHASRRDQVAEVFARYYAEVGEDLVLLTIDTARLDSAVKVEPVGGDTYPHIYGPINRRAVIEVSPLSRHGKPETVQSLWLKGMAIRMGVALAVMGLIAAIVSLVR